MPALIFILLVALVVAGVVYISVTAIAHVGYFLAMPSLVGISLFRFLGLTDATWSLVLQMSHATLGGLLGFWAHRARPRRVKVLLVLTVIAIYVLAVIIVGLSS